MDRAPKSVEDAIRKAIEAVEGVRAVRGVRVRRSGGRLQGDARVTARPTLSIEAAQGLTELVKAAALEVEPELDLDLCWSRSGRRATWWSGCMPWSTERGASTICTT